MDTCSRGREGSAGITLPVLCTSRSMAKHLHHRRRSKLSTTPGRSLRIAMALYRRHRSIPIEAYLGKGGADSRPRRRDACFLGKRLRDPARDGRVAGFRVRVKPIARVPTLPLAHRWLRDDRFPAEAARRERSDWRRLDHADVASWRGPRDRIRAARNGARIGFLASDRPDEPGAGDAHGYIRN